LPFGAVATRRLQRAREVIKNAVLQERFSKPSSPHERR
jgi:hypothetical protein